MGPGQQPSGRRVLVTGAGGFVGHAVVTALLHRRHAVVALARDRPVEVLTNADLRVARGDLFDPPSLDAAAVGCDAVVHLVGIIAQDPGRHVTFRRVHVEGTRRAIDAARKAGAKRFLHLSALGARPDDDASEYHRTKHEAEQLVRNAGMPFAILRPSMIHGPRGDLVRMLAGWARRTRPPWLFMPYFGAGLLGFGGGGLLQPVHVDDVARAMADLLDRPATTGRSYDLGGPDRIEWPALHAVVAEALVGRRRLSWPIPAWWAKLLAGLLPERLLGFNVDQVVMSQEDNVCDLTPFARDFGWLPRPFAESFRGYAGEIGTR